MKIVYLAPFYLPVCGGMEQHLQQISKELIKKGHVIEIWTSDLTHSGKLPQGELEIDGVKVKRFKTSFKFGFSSYWQNLKYEIEKSDADIFHFHSYRHFHNFGVNYVKSAKTILSPHWPEYPISTRGVLRTMAAKIFDVLFGKSLFKKYDLIHVQSLGEKNWVRKYGVPETKIKLVPAGVPETYLKKQNAKLFLQKFGIKNKKIILSVGRIHKSKGFDRLVRIAKFLPEDALIVIIGPDGGYLAKLKNLAKELNVEEKVLFTGPLTEEEKLSAYAACYVYCQASYFEGFGLTALEAMAQSKPVLVSKNIGMSYLLQKASIFGDETELVEKLKELLNNVKLAKQLGASMSKIAETMTWQNTAEGLERLYFLLRETNNKLTI